MPPLPFANYFWHDYRNTIIVTKLLPCFAKILKNISNLKKKDDLIFTMKRCLRNEVEKGLI